MAGATPELADRVLKRPGGANGRSLVIVEYASQAQMIRAESTFHDRAGIGMEPSPLYPRSLES